MNNTSQVSEAMITYGSTDDNRAFTLLLAVREGFRFSFFLDLSKKMPFSFHECVEEILTKKLAIGWDAYPHSHTTQNLAMNLFHTIRLWR